MVHELGLQGTVVPDPGDGPCTSTMKWGLFLYTHPKLHYFVMLRKSLFHLSTRAVSHCMIVASMPIESFLFLFKGNQERANEQLVKIEGICCLKE